MKSLKQLMEEKQGNPTSPAGQATPGVNKYVSCEYQDYGYRLAAELGDVRHKALYIKLAKDVPRPVMEKCRSFVLDSNADNKGALFMWKLKRLREGKNGK